MLAPLALAISSATSCGGGAAELLVFSGTPNPVVALNATVADAVCEALDAGGSTAVPSCTALGFTGIKLADGRVVRGHAVADELLLSAFEGAAPGAVLAHARAESARLIATGGDARCAAAAAAADAQHAAAATDCLDVPILQPQPDIPPVFDLKNDVRGCWVTECSKNNCYNYGNDIVTNSFAQPGMGSGKKWTANTCEAIKIAASRDGLVYINGTAGQPPPEQQPATGHIISMHIWPRTNFHWVRMDADLTFSHKPGGTSARNVDNDGKKITDPSKSNFSPWTEHCGYFTTIPSNVTIAGDRT